MKTVTYQGKSLDELLARARAELGDDALGVACSRLPGPDGLLEIVASLGASADEPEAAVEMPESVADRFERSLGLAGVSGPVAARLAAEARRDGDATDAALRTRIARLLGHAARVNVEPGVIVLAGPTGVGKTTMAAKIAAHRKLRRGDSPAFVTLDTFRVGAVEHLRIFAELLGVPLAVAEDTDDLIRAARLHARATPLIIDTPGLVLTREADLEQLRGWLACLPKGALHLVLSATTTPRLVEDILESVAPLEPAGLVFTKIDEHDALGLLITACARSGRPLRYLSDGPRVPADMHLPLPAALARRVIPSSHPGVLGS